MTNSAKSCIMQTIADPYRRRWRLSSRLLAALAAAACVAGILAGCSSSSGSTSGGRPFGATAGWNETWSKNPFNTNFYAGLANYWALLTLGFPEKTTDRVNMFDIIPQLMSSYSVSPSNKATIHLRANAKFSDGTPVDAKDVYNSILLSAVNQDFTFENDVQSVSTPDKHTVVIQFRSTTANVNSRGWILGIRPLPMSVYGKFIVPGLAKAAFGFNNLIASQGQTKAQQSPYYKLLHDDLQKLLKFEPKTFVGDGPFNIQRVTTAQATLVKSKTFYAASNVHVPSVTMTNSTTTSNIFPLLFSHTLDWYPATETSATILDRWKHTSGAHTLTFPNDISEEVLFNNKKYPFNLQPVRQALAQVIDRPKLVATETGGSSVNKPSAKPDGLTQLLNSVWLSPADLNGMDAYNHDESKAASLLQSAGFKKSGNSWTMPNGKRFTTEIIAPSTPSTALVAVREVAAELTEFGVKTTASTIQAAGYGPQIQKSGFSLAYQTGVGTNLEPMCGIATGGLGEPTNYTFTGSNGAVTQGQAGIGFGPKANIPGIGNVEVSQTIDTQCQNTNAGPKMAQLATAWARVVNSQMPYLTYADDYQVDRYSTTHYTDWPAPNSKYWQETGIYPNQALIWMLENGYVRPR